MRKGSLTLYLCLIMGVLLTLICTALFSARRAAGRVVLSSAAEQAMYSLFSRYDRSLFDEYGILAIDGGYGGSQLKLAALRDEAEEVVDFLTGSSNALTGPTNLMHLSTEKSEVTGYVLLTDGEGALLREQALRALAGKKAASLLQEVKEQVSDQSSQWKELEEKGASIDVKGMEAEYENLTQLPTDTAETTAIFGSRIAGSEIQTNLCTQEDTDAATDSENVQSAADNPIEIVKGFQKLGIINLVLPKDRSLSQGMMESDKVSARTLQKGMGILPVQEDAAFDKVLLLEYLMDSFQDFTEVENDAAKGLQYQIEYAIGGKNSDAENLKCVLNRILVIREASNYIFLLQDPVKQEEVQAAALAISTMIGLPVAEPVVAEMLRFCWAYGESILDLRELLKGGKIPLMKDASSWQLSLNMLTHLQEELPDQHSSDSGLNYQWYLRMLLVTENEERLTNALMDLLEHQIRNKEGREGFRLDNCLVSMKIKFRARQDKLYLLETERNYNYTE